MIYFLTIISFLSIATTIALAFYIRKLKKHFEDKIGEVQCNHRQLEEFYIKFHEEYAEHYYKYH